MLSTPRCQAVQLHLIGVPVMIDNANIPVALPEEHFRPEERERGREPPVRVGQWHPPCSGGPNRVRSDPCHVACSWILNCPERSTRLCARCKNNLCTLWLVLVFLPSCIDEFQDRYLHADPRQRIAICFRHSLLELRGVHKPNHPRTSQTPGCSWGNPLHSCASVPRGLLVRGSRPSPGNSFQRMPRGDNGWACGAQSPRTRRIAHLP